MREGTTSSSRASATAVVGSVDPCLSIEDLEVAIGGDTQVRDVSFNVASGSIHCLVGDSGSGKTLTSLAAVGLLPSGARTSGVVRIHGVDDNLLGVDERTWSSIRGRRVGYVGQNALGCLHPAFRVEQQLIEAMRRHRPLSRSEARSHVLDELAAVDLPHPERVARAYPAELSGGMCQRVAIAIALVNRPSVLIADEPTTSLDADTQERILELIRARVSRDRLGVLLITHDRTVVDDVADRVTTIVDGVASTAAPGRLVSTRVAARKAQGEPADSAETAVLEIRDVGKSYRARGWRRRADVPVLRDVTISADPRTTIGLVGRSGAGKTTLAQIVAGMLTPTAGSVHIAGRPITGPGRVDRNERADLVQYVFQDPFGSLNPRRTPLAQVAEPLIAAGRSGDEAEGRARRLLHDVGLDDGQITRVPTALSGGQCQRVGIARALIRRPQVVVLDEPVSALDWSIRDEIMAILAEQQVETSALYLLISHERALIERESDRIFEVVDGVVRPV
ncbi:MAG: ATP-binding cassette domain-containing protein [Actinomycetota bacterium]